MTEAEHQRRSASAYKMKLKLANDRIRALEKTITEMRQDYRTLADFVERLAGASGVEPLTYGIKVRCSTN